MGVRVQPNLARERFIVFIVGAVQFVNILDFMMVMPLGPDFARAFAIPTSQIGYVAGAYTAAAAVAGIAGSFFLDRFDRRPALALSVLGLAAATASGGLATSFETLLLARVAAGLFGGPATSLSFALLTDVVPVERRGRAMGAVMNAFALASIAGVPLGLELSARGGWQVPFLALGAVAAVFALAAYVALPSMREHITRAASVHAAPFRFWQPKVLLSYALTATVMAAGFSLIPNISAYLQGNLGVPRQALSQLYLSGGVCSLIATRVAGWLVDKHGPALVGAAGSAALIGVVFAAFFRAPPLLPVGAMFACFMTAMGFRNVAYNTLVGRVPAAPERARFMSFQSAVQHAASSAGAAVAGSLLLPGEGITIVGMANVATLSMVLSVLVVPILFLLERRVLHAAAAAPREATASRQ